YDPMKKDIPVIHSGIDTNKFVPLPDQKTERPTILFVGKIVQNKGVEELVEAACDLVKDFPGLQLQLAGRGKEELVKKLQEKADRPGATELLEFTGFITK